MPDIRAFFGPKGGAAPPKPAPKKEEDPPRKGRGKGRKVIEDSDEDDDVVEIKKPATKSAPRKKAGETTAVKGVETTASNYFASSKAKPAKSASSTKTSPNATPKAASKTQVRPGHEVRMSPRTKPPAVEPAKNGKAAPTKKSTKAYQKYDQDDDDAFMDDGEDADDIFAADAKSRHKRKNDDYAEEESEEEFLPKPKRVASRAAKPVLDESEDDFKPTSSKGNKKGPDSGKKRKSPMSDSDEDEEDVKPAKKTAPAKPRAPRAKKAAEPEPDDIQSILDNIPTVAAPDAPPKDENAKFDWRKGGGNAAAPPIAGAAEIPDGEPDCLIGKTFVFTGLLKTLSREDGQALVKRYGGKVTTAPSSKTDFVVLGDDAGPSKLKKIKDHGIKTIDEEGLFYLIKSLPAGGGTGKGAEKAKQKREENEKKVLEEAAKMEAEEKARKAEAEQAAKKAAAARGTAPLPPAQPLSQLWTTKYAPTALNQICGNKVNVERIQNWLRNWSKSKKYDFKKKGADGTGGYRAIIISGPPGIGKTTAAHLAAKLAGYDVLESNASDSRSKKLVENGVAEVMNNTSLLGYFAGDGKKVDAGKKNIVLVMDEVDGMSAGDRGGVGALAKFCKKTEIPLILICNERRLPKMKPFDHVAFDIKFTRPTVEQIRSRIMTIATREGMKLSPQVVDALIEGSNKDIRQIINMLSTARLDEKVMDFNQSKAMSKAWEKHVVLKPWDICQKLIGSGMFSPASKATLNDKIELYFNDHEFSFLMVQENYLRSKPYQVTAGLHPREANLKTLQLLDQAAESISDGDLVDRMIHGPQQHWSLMPTHAVFSTVRPASFIAGSFNGQTTFTSWLGNNSKYGKLSRYVREIHAHMRLKASGDHNEIRQQYLPVLWHQLIKKLSVGGKEAVPDVIELMDSYYLTRDDFDYIQELALGDCDEKHWPIETQTKATFTRTYNSMSHPVPFMRASNVFAPAKAKTKDIPDLEEAIEEEDDGEAVEVPEEDDELDLKADKYIKQPKKKAAPKKGKAVGDDEEEGDGKASKAKGKAPAARGPGRPKKT
ncbi:replication factor RFC1 C terminal domain-containing protein [Podospora aff. communis PSN243]|uniref:Replication factor C subunit 1 n=1 Tax=Podospora aff. communis PSN243 TaxID=3040156 RepID=A0AAV9H2M2_9PEZI|nr:replication factor RFC1 C terminal domain-containing protein [Podospora aff. communis PSN243]